MASKPRSPPLSRRVASWFTRVQGPLRTQPSNLTNREKLGLLREQRLVTKKSGKMVLTARGRLEILRSRGSTLPWELQSITQQRKWSNLLANLAMERIREDGMRATLRGKKREMRRLVVDELTSEQERVDQALSFLGGEVMKYDLPTERYRLLQRHAERMQNYSTVLKGTIRSIERGYFIRW